jgi:DNA-binding NtrC family response regulator
MPFITYGTQLAESAHHPYSTPLAATLLIVEDNDMLRQLFELALRQQGYQVSTAASVAEAEAFRQQQGLTRIRLVIADIQLSANPQAQEGYALYEQWSRARPGLPFLLMSGDPGSRALPAIRTGAVQFLAKPFSMHVLLDAIQALVGGP